MNRAEAPSADPLRANWIYNYTTTTATTTTTAAATTTTTTNNNDNYSDNVNMFGIER